MKYPEILRAAVGLTPAVLLHNPKYAVNVGNVQRACSCFDVGQLWWTGGRVMADVEELTRLPREERMKGYQEVLLVNSERPFEYFPSGTVPVCIEVREQAEPLTDFEHPDNALYVFGAEDGSVPQVYRRHCHRFVFVPTHHCLNLAAAVSVVLYDRRAKRQRAGLEERLPLHELLREQRGMLGVRP